MSAQNVKNAPSATLKNYIAYVAFGVVAIILAFNWPAPNVWEPTAEEQVNMQMIKANIERGPIMGSILEMRDGKLAVIRSELRNDNVIFDVVLNFGDKSGKTSYFRNEYTAATDDRYWMRDIVSITRPSDPNYAAMREKLLPSK